MLGIVFFVLLILKGLELYFCGESIEIYNGCMVLIEFVLLLKYVRKDYI